MRATELLISAAAAGTLTVGAKAMASVARPHLGKIAIGAGGLAAAGGTAYGAYKGTEANVLGNFESQKSAYEPDVSSNPALALFATGGSLALAGGGLMAALPRVPAPWKVAGAGLALTGAAALGTSIATSAITQERVGADIAAWRTANPTKIQTYEEAAYGNGSNDTGDGTSAVPGAGEIDGSAPLFDEFNLPNPRIANAVANTFSSDAWEDDAFELLRRTDLTTEEAERLLLAVEATFDGDAWEYDGLERFIASSRPAVGIANLAAAVDTTFSSDAWEYDAFELADPNWRSPAELTKIMAAVETAFDGDDWEYSALEEILPTDLTAAEVKTVLQRVTELYDGDSAEFDALRNAIG